MRDQASLGSDFVYQNVQGLIALANTAGGTRGATDLAGRFIVVVDEAADKRSYDGVAGTDNTLIGWLDPSAGASAQWTFDHNAGAAGFQGAGARWMGEQPDRTRVGAGFQESVFGNRINANLGWYETTDQNRQVGIDASWTNHVNAIWRTLGEPGRQISVYADSQDLSGDGYEFELTANITPEWRTSFNWSMTKQITDNVSPRTVAYMAAHRATWEARGALDLDRTGTALTAPTVAAALQNATVIVDSLLAGNGNIRRGLREHSGNLFTNYNFSRTSRFAGFGLGAGANYRGDTVLGYDSSQRNKPIYGSSHILVNAMVRYARKITAKKLDWRIQLNVDNALGEDELLVTDADQNRPYRFVYLTPRRWSISNTISF